MDFEYEIFEVVGETDKKTRAMRTYFEENKDVHLEYSLDRKSVCISINGATLKGRFDEVNRKLSKWLSPKNRVFIKSRDELKRIPALRELEVELIDFSGITFTSSLQTQGALLKDCILDELILPTFPEEIIHLSGLLENVKVNKRVDFNRALGRAKIYQVGSLFPFSTLDVIDLSEVNFTMVSNFSNMFFMADVETIVLPKNMGERWGLVKADNTFNTMGTILDIENLEYFPFDKLTTTSNMFANLTGGEITINSKLENLKRSIHMFGDAEDLIVNLPELEEVNAGFSDWFNNAKRCKINIPKLVSAEGSFIKGLKNLDETNEILCNNKLAEKLK